MITLLSFLLDIIFFVGGGVEVLKLGWGFVKEIAKEGKSVEKLSERSVLRAWF